MDLDQAHATLGVDASTPLSKVRASYVMRAQMLHPDRHQGNENLRAEAGRAMTQLNVAWETVQRAGEHRQPSAVPTAPQPAASASRSPGPLRLPYHGECDLCGCRPAQPVTFRRITGMVLFWQRYLFQAELCRSCGVGMFREMQSSTMIRGWWGLIAPLANVAALVANLGQYSRISRAPQPRSRDPHVVTPPPGPVPPGRPVFCRMGPWLALGVVTVILVAVAGNLGSTSDGSRTSPGDTRDDDGAIGTCMDSGGFIVSCADVDAVCRITNEGPTCASTQAAFEDPATGRTYCAVSH